ncbi:uncharacterized protein Tco025E_02355 [Trypanosoma conorhini]|uniref:Uncharacterized protein n=1 Tax=Trypanosoma conorhini TaxID=83891 RepID=A0A422Q5W2_9TRYP|nr:uncharacterized protein Tco025E_02355 [Trypanosoma conorhini]RNF25332.1 hypothetical protein Tco025E_02355 [Trypanosoma conorhini]
MTWVTSAAAVEQQQPPQQLLMRCQLSPPELYRTASPRAPPNGTPRFAAANSRKTSMYHSPSLGLGPQTLRPAHSSLCSPQALRPRQAEASLALDQLSLAQSTPILFRTSVRHMLPKLKEQLCLASRASCHATDKKASRGNRVAGGAYQVARTATRWASLMHAHLLGEDLADWKIFRRRADIGALVEFWALLLDREAGTRNRIEEEAFSLLCRLKRQEHWERLSAPLNSLTLPVARLKSPSIFNTSQVNKTPKYAIRQKEPPTWAARHPLAGRREDNKRWKNSELALKRQPIILSDEESAARGLITIVEEGCRRRLALAVRDCLRGVKQESSPSRGSGRWNEGKRRSGWETPKLEEVATSRVCQDAEKTPRRRRGSWGSSNAYCGSPDEVVRGGGASSMTSDACLSVSSGRFYFGGVEEVTLASVHSAGETAEDEVQRRTLSEPRRDATSGELLKLVVFEEVRSDAPLQQLDKSGVDTFFDSENERLEEAQACLFYEEQEARAEVMQLEEHGVIQLEERLTDFWLSRRVVDAVALQMENVLREEESRRIHICGSFFLHPEDRAEFSALSQGGLPPSLHRRFRPGNEQRERNAVRSMFLDGLRTATETAIAALLEQERQERAGLERDAQPQYTSVFWEMELMGERQELLLEEQSQRSGIEFAAMGHWLDLRLLQSLQQTSLLIGAKGMTLSDTESGVSSCDAEGNVYRRCPWADADGVNPGSSLLCLSHSARLDSGTRSKTTSRCSSLTSKEDGGSTRRASHGLAAETEALEPVCVDYALGPLRAEEREQREALHADWSRGYENLLELDGMATEEFTRVIALSNNIRMSSTPVILF